MSDSTATLDDILAAAENRDHARTATVRVLLRQDLAAKHAELDAELTAASARDQLVNEPDRAPALAADIEALEAEMEAAKVEFRFRSIGRKAWADLLAKHPPSKAQMQADRRTTFDPETFPIAAIAASCIIPEGMDEAAAKRLETALSDAQFSQLWNACIDANLGGVDLPKSLTAGLIRRVSGRSATTAAPGESLEAFS